MSGAKGRVLEQWLGRLEQQLDLEKLMLGCCKALAKLSRVDRCSIMVLDADADELVVRWAAGARVKTRAGAMKFRMGEGLCGWVAQSRKAHLSLDAGAEPRFIPYRQPPSRFRPVRAISCLPLVAKGRTVGVVNLSSFSAQSHSVLWFRGREGKRFLDRLAHVIWQSLLLRESEAVAARWRKQAKTASETVSHLSHEVRTPLALVSEAAEQLLEGFSGALSPEAVRRVKMIRTQAQRMLQLVTELLDLSRIEVGRLPLRRERMDPQTLIREVVGRYEELIFPRRLKLELERTEPVYGDPSRLAQVVENLLNNAVKFTPPQGAITVGLTTRGRAAEIAVADTGIGISPREQQKLFERFSQVTVPAEAGARGTGLGLAIVKEIVNLHGGTVRVSSEKGRGATFIVSLPLYSPALALTDEFRLMREEASRQGQALAAQLVRPRAGAEVSLEKVAALLGRHVSRQDRILESPGMGLVVLSVMDPEGLPGLRHRLMELLRESPETVASDDLQWGWALVPQEESTFRGVMELLAKRAGEGEATKPAAGG